MRRSERGRLVCADAADALGAPQSRTIGNGGKQRNSLRKIVLGDGEHPSVCRWYVTIPGSGLW